MRRNDKVKEELITYNCTYCKDYWKDFVKYFAKMEEDVQYIELYCPLCKRTERGFW